MPRLFPGNAPATSGERLHRTHALRLGLVMFVSIVLGNTAFAEGDEPAVSAPADSAAATDVPPPPPDEPPAPLADGAPAVAPTSESTEPPVPPTAAPTVTEAPAVDPTAAAGNPEPALDSPQTSLDAQPSPQPTPALTCVAADGVETACAAPGAAVFETSADLPPCAPTVSASGNTLDFGTSRWTGAAYPTVPGTLTLTIDATGAACTGLAGDWEIQVNALAMARVGGAQTIAPASLVYAGSAASGAPPTGISPVPGPVTLDGTGTIATTTGADTAGGSWRVAFSLSPPADTPPGTYTGTITIDVVASSSD